MFTYFGGTDRSGELWYNLGTLNYSQEATLSLFYNHYSRRCSSALVELVSLSNTRRRFNHYSDRLQNNLNSFFPCIVRPSNLCLQADFVWLMTSTVLVLELITTLKIFSLVCLASIISLLHHEEVCLKRLSSRDTSPIIGQCKWLRRAYLKKISGPAPKH